MVCSYFVSSSSAPDYLQRLTAAPLAPSGNANGIETFLVGKYVPGKENPLSTSTYDNIYSKLDREFVDTYMTQQAITPPPLPPTFKVKGMPNCKNKVACNDLFTARTEGAGIFALKSGSGGAYAQYLSASGTPITGLSLLCPDSFGNAILGGAIQSVCE
jgi:hypothetical protein